MTSPTQVKNVPMSDCDEIDHRSTVSTEDDRKGDGWFLLAQIQSLYRILPTGCLSFAWTSGDCSGCKEVMSFLLQLNDTLQNYSLRKEKKYYLVNEICKTILFQFPTKLENLARFRH